MEHEQKIITGAIGLAILCGAISTVRPHKDNTGKEIEHTIKEEGDTTIEKYNWGEAEYEKTYTKDELDIEQRAIFYKQFNDKENMDKKEYLDYRLSNKKALETIAEEKKLIKHRYKQRKKRILGDYNK